MSKILLVLRIQLYCLFSCLAACSNIITSTMSNGEYHTNILNIDVYEYLDESGFQFDWIDFEVLVNTDSLALYLYGEDISNVNGISFGRAIDPSGLEHNLHRFHQYCDSDAGYCAVTIPRNKTITARPGLWKVKLEASSKFLNSSNDIKFSVVTRFAKPRKKF